MNCMFYVTRMRSRDKAFDELFEISFLFRALPDVYRDTGFNLRLLACSPSGRTSKHLEGMPARFNHARDSLQEAKWAFLNPYFGVNIVRPSYVYNANLAIRERRPVLWHAMRDEMHISRYTSPMPFPKDGKDIVDCTRLEHFINETKRHRGGMHAEASAGGKMLQRIQEAELFLAAAV